MQTQAYIRHLAGNRFEVSSGSDKDYSFFMQGASPHPAPPGIRPMETVLTALATCSSIDVVSILKKSKQVFNTFEVSVAATRRDQIPNVFTDIELTFSFTHNPNTPNALVPPKVDRAIDLALNKYCSVATMLRAGGVVIRYHLQISPAA